ncbi:nebulin-like [Canis aureus]
MSLMHAKNQKHLASNRLYKSVYEKNKMRIHIVPDMVEMVTAKESQKKGSEIDYCLHLCEWICHPDLQVNSHIRKVTDQIYSNIVYKDDLNWLKGIGCYISDIPEILHAKHAYVLCNHIKYKSHTQKTRNGYKLVTDTQVYVQAVKSGKQLSDAIYHHDYMDSVRGKVAATMKTMELDGPFMHTSSRVSIILSSSIHVYGQLYHRLKDKIHTTPDTPEIRQVKKTQEAVSELIYKSDFFKMQGHVISLPYTPQVIRCRYVGDITSDV